MNKKVVLIFHLLHRSALVGSAICIYTVNELQRVFTSSFLTQKSNESYWLPSKLKQEPEKVIFSEIQINFDVVSASV